MMRARIMYTKYQISHKYVLTSTIERFIGLSWNESNKRCFQKHNTQTYKILNNAQNKKYHDKLFQHAYFDVRSAISPNIKRECSALKYS